jgi:uncharacterized protein (DUF302 family)
MSCGETDLEKEFERVFDEVHPQIQDKLAQAAKLIREAEALSEKHGIPFRPKEEIMFCRPSYLPDSLNEKFPDLDSEFWNAVTDAWAYDYQGWQQSQVC